MQRLSIIKLLIILLFISYGIISAPYAFQWLQTHISNERVHFAYGKSLIMFLGIFIFGCITFFITKYIKSLKLNYIIYDIITFVVVGIAVFAYIFIIINAETLWWLAVGSSLIIIGTSNDSGLSTLIFGNPITYFLNQTYICFIPFCFNYRIFCSIFTGFLQLLYGLNLLLRLQ